MQQQAARVAERTKAISLLALQAENVQRNYINRGEVDHSCVRRIVATLLRLRSHFKITRDDKDRLASRFGEASDGNAAVIVNDNGTIYLNGVFDVKTLARYIIW